MKKRILLIPLALLLVISLAAGCAAPAPAPAPAPTPAPAPAPAAPAEVIKWEFQTLHSSGSISYAGMLVKIADLVEKMSDGRLIINVHPANEIVPAFEMTEACRDGVLDAVHADMGSAMAIFGAKTLLLGASGYPAGTITDEDWAWMYVGDGLKLAAEVFEGYTIPIGYCPEGQELFAHSHKPLETAADLDGLKYRTIGLWAEVLGTFGATVLTLPFPEIYPAAEKGVVDAFECAGPAINYSVGFHEVMEYIGTPGIHSPGAGHPYQINPDSWNELPDDIKQMLISAIKDAGATWRNTLLYEDSLAMVKFEDYGIKFFTVSDELQAEIAKRSLEVTEKYAAEDPLFKKIWENKKAFVKPYREMKRAAVLNYSIYD